jgi:hypothetical protein
LAVSEIVASSSQARSGCFAQNDKIMIIRLRIIMHNQLGTSYYCQPCILSYVEYCCLSESHSQMQDLSEKLLLVVVLFVIPNLPSY